MNNLFRKINLYVLSLGLLFIFIIIITASPPDDISTLKSLSGWIDLVAHNYVPLFSFALVVYCCLAYKRFNYEIKGATQIPFTITRIENADYEHLTFLATYVVPLISFDFASWRQLLVLGLLLIAMGIIYVKTDLFYANPSLALLGFRIYRVNGTFKDGNREGLVLICRDALQLDQKVTYIKLDEKTYYARGIAK